MIKRLWIKVNYTSDRGRGHDFILDGYIQRKVEKNDELVNDTINLISEWFGDYIVNMLEFGITQLNTADEFKDEETYKRGQTSIRGFLKMTVENKEEAVLTTKQGQIFFKYENGQWLRWHRA